MLARVKARPRRECMKPDTIKPDNILLPPQPAQQTCKGNKAESANLYSPKQVSSRPRAQSSEMLSLSSLHLEASQGNLAPNYSLQQLRSSPGVCPGELLGFLGKPCIGPFGAKAMQGKALRDLETRRRAAAADSVWAPFLRHAPLKHYA